VYAFETIDPDIDPRFFMYSLVAPPFTKYVNALSGRTRMPKVNQNQMFAFEFTYPSLLDQRRIVSHLDKLLASMAKLKRSQAESAAEL
jgi:restriction endonuclease S subunit